MSAGIRIDMVADRRARGFRNIGIPGASAWLVLAVAVAACSPAGSSGSSGVVRLVTHSSPGGGSDVFLREMIPHLTRVMGGTFVVENVQGGSGARAVAAVAAAKPDGHLLYATTPTYVYTSLLSRPDARYTDLEPLVNMFFDPEVLYTAADSRFATLADVLAHARSGGGRWGAANPASLERQVMERVKQRAKVTPSVTTFEGGGDMLLNVLNHTLDMGVGELQEIRAQLDAGRLRLLAVVGDARLPQYPQIPTAREQGVDLAVRKFRGLAGPKGLPRDVIGKWEAAVPKLLDDPAYRALYTANGLQPGFMPHDEYVTFMTAFGKETEAFLHESGVIE